jgi:hypothetical protein
MRIAAAVLLIFFAGIAAAQDADFLIGVAPSHPTTASPVIITITGFCYGEPVRSGNVFTITSGGGCIPEPIVITQSYNVGVLQAGNYEVRVVVMGDPDTPIASRAFAVTEAALVPTLHEYGALALVLLIAAIGIRRMS